VLTIPQSSIPVQCSRCQKPVVSGRAMCADHLRAFTGYSLRLHAKRRANGLCAGCGRGQPLPAFAPEAAAALCETCYLKKASRMRLGSARHWQALRVLLERQEWRCAYTGVPLVLGVNDSVDHIYPRSRFPERAPDPTNVEWVCRAVNEMKRDRTPDEFLALLHEIIAYRGSVHEP
jgi:hypothetical protein